MTFVAAALCALIVSGCASMQSSGIDPTGEHIFVQPPSSPPPTNMANERFYDEPLGRLPWDDASVQLQPRETVAAIGSEVVLIAGVCGQDGYLRTNRRLEWSIDAGSVGQFVAVGETGLVDLLVGDFNRPRKITNTYAIGSTLRANTRLNRGACKPEDFAYVLRGQGWITLTSSTEGTSHVTVVAPEVYSWDARLKSAMVHWVDAHWQFPAPAINPAGTKHVFTTTVTRQSNQTPCEGWRVRYEIASGPPAGFLPDGAQAIEVPTNSAGQANAEIFQQHPAHGTNMINIQVIRPAELPGAVGRRLVVGSGTTTKTWTAADLAVKTSGPTAASVGATLVYRIDVSNPGDLPAREIVATDVVPDGLTFLSSNPPAEAAGRQIQWRLGDLGARQHRLIEASFRAERPESVTNCCEVTAAGGLKVSDCATTTISAPVAAPSATGSTIDIQIVPPPQATVGGRVTFDITVTNRGPRPATNLTIKDRFDPGLEHEEVVGKHSIERSLGDLAAGASRRIGVTFRVTQPGRLCHTVEVTGPDVATATAQSCVTAVGGTVAPGPGLGGGLPPLGSGERPKAEPGMAAPLTVTKTGPKQQLVGEKPKFTIEVKNTGTAPLRNLKVVDSYDMALMPTDASEGFRVEGVNLAWTIENLAAGKSNSFEVVCRCESASLRACNRVTVTTPDGLRAGAEACLEIRSPTTPSLEKPPAAPAGEGLTIAVVGTTNPVTAGKELTYVITVTNKDPASYRQVIVTATVPQGMVPNPLGTSGAEGTTFTREGQAFRFTPAAELRPGDSLTYRVRALAKEPGKSYRFRAELSADGLSQPKSTEETTEVIPKP